MRSYSPHPLYERFRVRVTRAWHMTRMARKLTALGILLIAAALVAFGVQLSVSAPQVPSPAEPVNGVSFASVAGENYQICPSYNSNGTQEYTPAAVRYLTSPWTYHAPLDTSSPSYSNGSQSFTVAQYKGLPGYGSKLPPLPSYIADENATTEAVVIFAPGAPVVRPSYLYPDSPLIYFFEGGSYGELDLQSVSGDEFIGGSAPGYPEAKFDDGGKGGGLDNANDHFGFSGAASRLAVNAVAGANSVTLSSAVPSYAHYLTFADGTTRHISNSSGSNVVLSSPLTASEARGNETWTSEFPPIGTVASGAAQGAKTLAVKRSSIPFLRWGVYAIGADPYTVTSTRRANGSGYILGVSGLDVNVAENTPVFYYPNAGSVSVKYLDISNDQHATSGTIAMGSGWTVEHNDIHDSYGTPGSGVALYGGDESRVEYNCFARMGEYGYNAAGTNGKFDYNEILQTAYSSDPGCGCSGGGKWWGTLNADIVDNAFVDDGTGGDQPVIWLDNGNSGTLVEGNYFFHDAGTGVTAETGYDMKVDGNLFLDDGWGSGAGGGGNNNDGAVNINSSGGIYVPNSRYENEILISRNKFVNDWMGLDIWQSTQRSCMSVGETGPGPHADAFYCSGGFPVTDTTKAAGKYYFSHIDDDNHDVAGPPVLAQPAAVGSRTILVKGPEAIDDRVGFGDPMQTSTSSRVNVSELRSSSPGTISVLSTAGFPSSGQLRVGTSNSWSDGNNSYTGAILAYSGTTANSFTGVSLVRGAGRLSGPILQVQPYGVTAEKCYANDCQLTLSTPVASSEAAGTKVTNAGTCQLYATSTATPSSPMAPDGVSYWDGCQWESRNVSVTHNTFIFEPSVIAHGPPPRRNRTRTSCTAGSASFCGTNFMAFQTGGEPPFSDGTGGYAMMSDPSLSGCPSWDAGCKLDPLDNMNALSGTSDHASPGRGELPYADNWSDNRYEGPWRVFAFSYGGCTAMPADPRTGKSMPSSACGYISVPRWQSAWQQDRGSTYIPTAASHNNSR